MFILLPDSVLAHAVNLHLALQPLDDGLGGTAPTPDGMTAEQVGPGFLGYLFTFGVAVGLVFLCRDMVKRLRRVKQMGAAQDQAQEHTRVDESDASRDATDLSTTNSSAEPKSREPQAVEFKSGDVKSGDFTSNDPT